MGTAERVIGWSSRALAFVGTICTVLMMVHVVTDSLAKYFLNLPLEGTLEIVSQYYMVAVVFLPLGIVELRGEQVHADLFVRLMPRWMARSAYIVTGLLTTAFFLILARYTADAALHSTRIGEVMMGTSYIIIWPSKWLLPIGLVAAAAAILLRLAQAIASWRRSKAAPTTAAD